MRRLIVVSGFVCGVAVCLTGLQAQKAGAEWVNYQQDSNYSSLMQITPQNVTKLTKAWTFNYGAGSEEAVEFVGLDYRFQVQPLVIDGRMYISTPGSEKDKALPSTVTALEPESGKVIWQFKSPRNIHGRGLAYWKGRGSVGPRLYFATDKGYMMSLDVKTGQPAAGFGADGIVDVYKGVASEAVGERRRDTYTVPNPITVFKDILITGARPGEDGPPQPRGDIRGWDAASGKLVWTFHTVPQPGEPNHEDWQEDTWKDRSGCNVWSNLTADEATGLVFGATGDANRAVPGKNLYCNSIVALEAETGRLKWYFQLVHHDAADYDMPTPPMLVNVRRNGRTIPAVLQTGKLHFAYIFARTTGEPIYGSEERAVRRGLGDADQNSPMQPFPLKPGPVGRLSMTRNDINKMTPEIEKYCTEFWDTNHIVPSGPFDRATQDESMVTFGAPVGGWGPLSYNPTLGLAFLNVTNQGTYHAAGTLVAGAFGAGRAAGAGGLRGRGAAGAASAGGAGAAPGAAPADGPAAAGARVGGAGAARGGRAGGDGFAYRLPSGALVSCVAPPYGALTAVNVNTGEIAWSVPLGLNEQLAELGEVGLKSGVPNIGGSIATASGLVFIGATVDHRFRAFDAKTGRELWMADLPANGNATPITYMGKDGAQYIVIAAAGGGPAARGQRTSDSLVAFKLGK